MADLKPCPFCGSNAVTKDKATPFLSLLVLYEIKCLGCGAKIQSKSFVSGEIYDPTEYMEEWNALDEKWNRRAEDGK